VDAIAAAASNIVFQCRSLERGFVSTVDREALDRDVETLVEATETFDPDAPFRRPAPAVEPETTLRDQVELALARRDENGCSPEDAERLRDALGD
jgi:hypothetical protein